MRIDKYEGRMAYDTWYALGNMGIAWMLMVALI